VPAPSSATSHPWRAGGAPFSASGGHPFCSELRRFRRDQPLTHVSLSNELVPLLTGPRGVAKCKATGAACVHLPPHWEPAAPVFDEHLPRQPPGPFLSRTDFTFRMHPGHDLSFHDFTLDPRQQLQAVPTTSTLLDCRRKSRGIRTWPIFLAGPGAWQQPLCPADSSSAGVDQSVQKASSMTIRFCPGTTAFLLCVS